MKTMENLLALESTREHMCSGLNSGIDVYYVGCDTSSTTGRSTMKHMVQTLVKRQRSCWRPRQNTDVDVVRTRRNTARLKQENIKYYGLFCTERLNSPNDVNPVRVTSKCVQQVASKCSKQATHQ